MDGLVSVVLDILIIIVCIYATLNTNKHWVRILFSGGLLISLAYLVIAVSYISLSTYGISWDFIAHMVLGCISVVGALIFLLVTSDII